MPYTVVDLLEKFILIEKSGYELFMKLAEREDVSSKLKTIIRVFAKEEERHIEFYTNLKEQEKVQKEIEIDFEIYDKALKLVYDFLKFDEIGNINNVNDILQFCLDLEKKNLVLALSIQGILVKSNKTAETENYKVLSIIISEEKRHISNIESFLNKVKKQ